MRSLSVFLFSAALAGCGVTEGGTSVIVHARAQPLGTCGWARLALSLASVSLEEASLGESSHGLHAAHGDERHATADSSMHAEAAALITWTPEGATSTWVATLHPPPGDYARVVVAAAPSAALEHTLVATTTAGVERTWHAAHAHGWGPVPHLDEDGTVELELVFDGCPTGDTMVDAAMMSAQPTWSP